MNDSIAVEIQTETPAPPPKTLEEQRVDLCLRLQINRRLLEHKLLGTGDESHFPRSAAMRFLSRQSTHQLIKKAANTALGIETFRTIHYGYSLVKFIRGVFSRHKIN
jgi:hypothetical protein